MILIRKHTFSISRMSMTVIQSLSAILKADQGMCFTSRFSLCNEVIGPYNSSAEARNKPIDLKAHVNEERKIKQIIDRPDEVCLPGLTSYKQHRQNGT